MLQKKQRSIGREIYLWLFHRYLFRRGNNKIYHLIFGELDVKILLKLFGTNFNTKSKWTSKKALKIKVFSILLCPLQGSNLRPID